MRYLEATYTTQNFSASLARLKSRQRIHFTLQLRPHYKQQVQARTAYYSEQEMMGEKTMKIDTNNRNLAKIT